MKRLVLKKWVKILLAILFLVVLARYSAEYTRKQIISCVEGGNTINFCKYHLGK